jgi:hypothetical protein
MIELLIRYAAIGPQRGSIEERESPDSTNVEVGDDPVLTGQ